MDKLFPEPELDDRFELVVQAITGTVAEHGYAEMWNVPGDQQAAPRKQVRSAVKKRTSHGTQTLACGSLLVFVGRPGDGLMRRCRACRPRRGEDGE